VFIINKKEFAIFASALRTYYPKENLLPNEQAMQLWFNQLYDIPYKVAEVTLNKWVATNKWSPSIADIREQATGLTQGEAKEWGDAWQEVLRAISKFGSYREDEALASLDDTTRTVVRRLGFRNLCFSEEIQVDRANFRMIYEREIQRERQDAQLPPKLKELITNTTLLLGEGGAE
jgi:hypothetical protein